MSATFSILTSDRLTATERVARSGGAGCDFQYPDLGSFDCNLAWVNAMGKPPVTFSILTSDRLTATHYEAAQCYMLHGFQYPDLGSFDCNPRDPRRRAGGFDLSVS